jgi:hypothetical protein
MERRKTPSPLYFKVTFLARDIRSATSDLESSVNPSASSNVTGSSLFRSLSETVSIKEIIVLLAASSKTFLDYCNHYYCQQTRRSQVRCLFLAIFKTLMLAGISR